jgi:hypothetical protein
VLGIISAVHESEAVYVTFFNSVFGVVTMSEIRREWREFNKRQESGIKNEKKGKKSVVVEIDDIVLADHYAKGKTVRCRIVDFNLSRKRIYLSFRLISTGTYVVYEREKKKLKGKQSEIEENEEERKGKEEIKKWMKDFGEEVLKNYCVGKIINFSEKKSMDIEEENTEYNNSDIEEDDRKKKNKKKKREKNNEIEDRSVGKKMEECTIVDIVYNRKKNNKGSEFQKEEEDKESSEEENEQENDEDEEKSEDDFSGGDNVVDHSIYGYVVRMPQIHMKNQASSPLSSSSSSSSSSSLSSFDTSPLAFLPINHLSDVALSPLQIESISNTIKIGSKFPLSFAALDTALSSKPFTIKNTCVLRHDRFLFKRLRSKEFLSFSSSVSSDSEFVSTSSALSSSSPSSSSSVLSFGTISSPVYPLFIPSGIQEGGEEEKYLKQQLLEQQRKKNIHLKENEKKNFEMSSIFLNKYDSVCIVLTCKKMFINYALKKNSFSESVIPLYPSQLHLKMEMPVSVVVIVERHFDSKDGEKKSVLVESFGNIIGMGLNLNEKIFEEENGKRKKEMIQESEKNEMLENEDDDKEENNFVLREFHVGESLFGKVKYINKGDLQIDSKDVKQTKLKKNAKGEKRRNYYDDKIFFSLRSKQNLKQTSVSIAKQQGSPVASRPSEPTVPHSPSPAFSFSSLSHAIFQLIQNNTISLPTMYHDIVSLLYVPPESSKNVPFSNSLFSFGSHFTLQNGQFVIGRVTSLLHSSTNVNVCLPSRISNSFSLSLKYVHGVVPFSLRPLGKLHWSTLQLLFSGLRNTWKGWAESALTNPDGQNLSLKGKNKKKGKSPKLISNGLNESTESKPLLQSSGALESAEVMSVFSSQLLNSLATTKNMVKRVITYDENRLHKDEYHVFKVVQCEYGESEKIKNVELATLNSSDIAELVRENERITLASPNQPLFPACAIITCEMLHIGMPVSGVVVAAIFPQGKNLYEKKKGTKSVPIACLVALSSSCTVILRRVDASLSLSFKTTTGYCKENNSGELNFDEVDTDADWCAFAVRGRVVCGRVQRLHYRISNKKLEVSGASLSLLPEFLFKNTLMASTSSESGTDLPLSAGIPFVGCIVKIDGDHASVQLPTLYGDSYNTDELEELLNSTVNESDEEEEGNEDGDKEMEKKKRKRGRENQFESTDLNLKGNKKANYRKQKHIKRIIARGENEIFGTLHACDVEEISEIEGKKLHFPLSKYKVNQFIQCVLVDSRNSKDERKQKNKKERKNKSKKLRIDDDDEKENDDNDGDEKENDDNDGDDASGDDASGDDEKSSSDDDFNTNSKISKSYNTLLVSVEHSVLTQAFSFLSCKIPVLSQKAGDFGLADLQSSILNHNEENISANKQVGIPDVRCIKLPPRLICSSLPTNESVADSDAFPVGLPSSLYSLSSSKRGAFFFMTLPAQYTPSSYLSRLPASSFITRFEKGSKNQKSILIPSTLLYLNGIVHSASPTRGLVVALTHSFFGRIPLEYLKGSKKYTRKKKKH